MSTSLRRALVYGIAAALVVGCGQETKHQQPTPVKTATDEKAAKVREFIEQYNAFGVAGKERIIQSLSREETRLVPFSYSYPYKSGRTYGDVYIGIEGRIGVYFRDHEGTAAEFELHNSSTPLRVEDGKIVAGWFEKESLDLPAGYSMLTVRKSPSPKQATEMLWALRRFGKDYPEVGITPAGRMAVQDGLISLGYKTN